MIAMLTIGSIWKIVDLARAPHDRVLQALVACLLLLTVGEVLSFPEVNRFVDAFTAVGVGKIAFNAIYMSGLGALVLFFSSSMRGANATYQRQLWINVGLLAGTLLALVISMIATPAAMRDHTLSTPYVQSAIAWFYVIGNTYFVYAYLISGLWALRYARMASQHLALGLRTATLGLFGLA
ncbi:MAB_1171c family putative transporter, partial [Streptomyces sp. 21So2-11]|uniref:MAB_1171c family putative transporter n=1 Tax=Streptomyces sp. 21So2-11 TaxID=3144408 RepID=UPI00321BC3F1